jgi:hypothetical protein
MTPMDRPSWTLSLISTVALVCALLLVAGVAMAAPPLLPDAAFRTLPACAPIDPFADADAAAREQRLDGPCGGEGQASFHAHGDAARARHRHRAEPR